ncbi:MAG: amidohydrolase family protein [Candidatus Lokiarchaeota archaeon]|nr:amidohydrolase family protein [Candidatus Lokiarchaeota archaeon]MBD3340972.1 amidohydrolase family protein [Candidatus Lokiarchaeota archaeon]
MSYDLIIKGGKIVDGKGNPWYTADVGIKNGKVEKISYTINDDASEIIDAKSFIVCPGFIDIHSHTDFVLPFYTKMDTAIKQGITTSVVGMCGDGLAPIPKEKVEIFKRHFTTLMPIDADLPVNWSTFSEYLNEIEKQKITGNLAFFVGYGAIRIAGGPVHENRDPTPQEMNSMKELLREAMEAGAFGMSTGLIYAPQVYAKTEELIDLMKTVAEYDGMYFSHIRSEGDYLIEALKEFIEIVEKSGCVAGEIAHHKAASKSVYGKTFETLELIAKANERGINITCDSYPYTRGMTSLITVLPPWVREGGKDKIIERLKDKDLRERIIRDTSEGIESWENWIKNLGFQNIFITHVKSEKWKDVEGKNISDITKIKGKQNDWQTLFELLIDEDAGVPITIESQKEEDVRRIMKSRYQMFGTDGIGSPHIKGSKTLHPRCYGTYPRIIDKYVKSEKLLTLEEAIRKMSSFPAQILRLNDRGIIQENCWADIVIFDYDKIKDKGTYEDPHQFPEGINYVIVNGVVVVKNGKQLRKYPGKVLRKAL